MILGTHPKIIFSWFLDVSPKSFIISFFILSHFHFCKILHFFAYFWFILRIFVIFCTIFVHYVDSFLMCISESVDISAFFSFVFLKIDYITTPLFEKWHFYNLNVLSSVSFFEEKRVTWWERFYSAKAFSIIIKIFTFM